jgi:hypothetical protein
MIKIMPAALPKNFSIVISFVCFLWDWDGPVHPCLGLHGGRQDRKTKKNCTYESRFLLSALAQKVDKQGMPFRFFWRIFEIILSLVQVLYASIKV